MKRLLILATVVTLLMTWALAAQVNILTNRDQGHRTGTSLIETTLTAANVTVTEFGKLYSYPLDGEGYAEPLYVTDVKINSASHNVLYVATLNGKLYAFDADVSSMTPLWMRDFSAPLPVIPVPIIDAVAERTDLARSVSIHSTPVIDRAIGTIYVLVHTNDSGKYTQRLHALDISTGRPRSGNPIRLDGSGRGPAAEPAVGTNLLSDGAKATGRGGHVMRGPVWDSPTDGPLVYLWAENDLLKAYRLNAGRMITPALMHGEVLSSNEAGASLTLSADGSTHGTGIVWASTPSQDDVDGMAGILRAYDAETLREIWTSEQNPTRDHAGRLPKFVRPVVANGRVYMPNIDGSVGVYGLLPAGAPDVIAGGTEIIPEGNRSTAAAVAPGAGAIGINFVGTSATLMGTAESAGVITKPNWNNAVGAVSSTTLPLLDEFGMSTSAAVTWRSNNGWMIPIGDQPGNARLMKGYLDTTSTSTTTITVTGLAQSSYDVYVYADGDNRGYGRSAAYTMSGAGMTTTTVNLTDAANTNFGTTFTPATDSNGNYAKFTITATGFTLSATPTAPADGTRRAPVNGIQIVPVPSFAVDFTITATPASRIVSPGASTSYAAAITALNGFNGTVALTVTGAPAGTTATFAPATVSGAGNATLTITTSSGTPRGSSSLTMQGTSGQLSHTATVTLVVGAQSAIGIDFVGTSTATMVASESAGVVPKTHWNNAPGVTRSTPLALVDDAGTPTTASVTWAANNGWMTPITDQPGNTRLMKGYLDTSSTSVTTVTVAGLPSATYDVYVYADGDNRQDTRTAAYRIRGTDTTESTVNLSDQANTNFSGTFTQSSGTSGNFVKFTVSGTGFTLTATPGASTGATRRAPVNALQIVSAFLTPPVSLEPPITVTGIGAGQGVEVRDGKVYLYGDANTGVVREYDVVGNNALGFTGRQILLTAGGRDLASHPTGLTVMPGVGTLLGDTVSGQGTIFMIDWARALANGTLDGAVQATVADDLAVNGTRPEFVRVGQRWLVATADYGSLANEVRLYDPERLKTAVRTSEPGVLVYRFRSSPYVQTLHWLDAPGLLVLVQNQREAEGWRLTIIDLARSIAAGQEVVTQMINLSPRDELEGFHLLDAGRGLFLTSSAVFNVYFANTRLF
jgi:hypothetical protein